MSRYKSLLSIAVILALAGCGKGGGAQAGGGPGAGAGAAPPPPAVQVASVKRDDVTVYREYTAELKPVQTVDIRTRVNGTLESVNFAEGSMVTQGQTLFQLDPEPLLAEISSAEAALVRARANVSQAQGRVSEARGAVAQAEAQLHKAKTQVNFQESSAQLARAEAALEAAEREVRRYYPLRDQGAIPGQQYDQAVDRRDVAKAERDAVRAQLTNTTVNDKADVGVAEANLVSARASLESAVAAVEVAQADVQAAQSKVDSARIDLGYTTIKAPFTGFIGRLNLDRGTMIVMGNAVLATLNSADPIYADFSISEPEYLQYKSVGGFSGHPFSLILTNGEVYSESGQFVLTENNVDARTGALIVRARFDNPDYLLKPGGFGRVKMVSHKVDDAIVIPQKAIFSNQSLNAAYVVKEDNSVEMRPLELGDRVDDIVVVKNGLKEGETVVVEGLLKVRPGITVTPEAAAAKPQEKQPNKAGAVLERAAG